MAAGIASTKASQTLLSLAAAFPLLVCVRDTTFSLCRVHGSSMEPNLKHGDILVIRKADFPLLRRQKGNVDESLLEDIHGEDDETKTRRVREYEFQHFMAKEDATVWARWPPWPLRGQIVTYRSPDVYPPHLVIKRVVGVAGQVVETANGIKDVDMNSVWVEGDNAKMSTDSRDHGAVNQKLIVGVAEYCVWPPSRIRKILRKSDDKRAYWM
ncbi:Signal peptidase, peptidase S26 [Seminavis robusta]|uniref:Mitochondrial inner membrane protease subunit 2 n=1 Tax=Seminavis robusta TaxID=568900 RepID=A0A9N8E2Z8_9STRA|nr:Signal peptidase, peptidase S26 [Seminavis robusta]|eukprot:Sro599_g173180.1 Signal peptidase, peptidase S26 (212) ;mRNA; r:14093-14852